MRAGLKKLLLKTNAIKSIVGDRVYINRVRQKAKKNVDHIVITQIGSDEHGSLDGTSELRFLDFGIDCKATDSAKAGTLAKAVRDFLKDYTGPAGDQTISAVLFQNESDGFEPCMDGSDDGTHITSLDIQIQYQPA